MPGFASRFLACSTLLAGPQMGYRAGKIMAAHDDYYDVVGRRNFNLVTATRNGFVFLRCELEETLTTMVTSFVFGHELILHASNYVPFKSKLAVIPLWDLGKSS